METRTAKIKELKPAKYNPRKILQSGEPKYKQLKKSLSKYGMVVPIIVNKNNVVISGHQRLNILKELGVQETEVVEIDVDEKEEKQLNIALNKIEGRWDWQKLNEMLETMTDEELEFTDFVDEEIEVTPKTVTKLTKPTKPKEFIIYVSFANKENANEWTKQHKIPAKFDTEYSITVNMEELGND